MYGSSFIIAKTDISSARHGTFLPGMILLYRKSIYHLRKAGFQVLMKGVRAVHAEGGEDSYGRRRQPGAMLEYR